GAQCVEPEVRNCLMRVRNCLGVEFKPAGIRQFNESAGGSSQSLEIRSRKFQAFCFPFRRNRKPIDATALYDQPRPQLAWREEQSLKRRIAEVVSLPGFVRPCMR